MPTAPLSVFPSFARMSVGGEGVLFSFNLMIFINIHQREKGKVGKRDRRKVKGTERRKGTSDCQWLPFDQLNIQDLWQPKYHT